MNRHVIIGTAGHVDHGKTTLIQALTGVDTDRLKEEKERELSIELGFAPFQLPGGRQASVIDVPGHRRFMGNMLAGISGIDLVLLVIDLQEGVMPQTREHLQVLDLLGIKMGIVVLTKADLVEDEWVELMQEEVQEALAGSSFSGAPMVVVSGTRGDGLPILLKHIDDMVDTVAVRNQDLPFRIYIDRVFSLKGFGTVVTGTLREGRIREGEIARLLPQGREVRIRQIQVHGERIEEALAGQRVALNLPDLASHELDRGDVLCCPSSFIPTEMMDVRLEIVSDFPHSLKENSRVHFHLGSCSVLARVRILGQGQLEPGEVGYARFYFDRPVVGGYGDPFIIRFYSPVQTMGGGMVLDERPRFGREAHLLSDLKNLYQLKDPYRILYSLKKKSLLFLSDFMHDLHPRPLHIEEILSQLVKEGRIIQLGKDAYLLAEDYQQYLDDMEKLLRQYHREYHLEEGMGTAELALALNFPKGFRLFLSGAVREGLVVVQGERVYLAGFSPTPTPREEELLKAVEDRFLQAGTTPPGIRDLCQELGTSPNELSILLGYLSRKNTLWKVEEGFYLHPQVMEEVVEKTAAYLKDEGAIRANEFRDLLQTTRKYAIPLLEYLETMQVTKREGDLHYLRRRE